MKNCMSDYQPGDDLVVIILLKVFQKTGVKVTGLCAKDEKSVRY